MVQIQLSIDTIREQGLGQGFRVINQADGFRGGNRLWFGNCETCGERVTNSIITGLWQHTITEYEEYWVLSGVKSWTPNTSRSRQVDYCPTSRGEVYETQIVVKEIS
jgi:hypothetical protein